MTTPDPEQERFTLEHKYGFCKKYEEKNIIL